MSRLREESGISLTEVMAAMVVAVILFGAAITTWVEFLDVSGRSESQTKAQDTARTTIERIGGHLRNAMTTGTSSAAVNASSSSFDLFFLTPLPGTTSTTTNPRGLSHVRYCLTNAGSKNDSIYFQTHPYDSVSQPNPPDTARCPSNAWDTKAPFVDHVVNRTAAGTPALFTMKTDGATPPSVTHVEIHPVVDWNADKSPDATELRSTVNLRNLNRAPTASLSCQGLANGHALCDGSASSDPDGEALTYSWAMNGTTLVNESSFRLDKYPLTSKTTYSFRLTVTDAAGVTATATRTVTMP
jgi:Tfp pilus assembly protein PilE